MVSSGLEQAYMTEININNLTLIPTFHFHTENTLLFFSVVGILGLQLSNSASSKTVRLSVHQPQLMSEAYYLRVDTAGQFIEINGSSEAGLFYGVQSLLSLRKTFPNGMQEIEITDKPRFEHRGMHVDVARNFHTVEDLKRLMDGMVMYKMNKLHLHLSDDEGWRLDIPDLPELTMVRLLLRTLFALLIDFFHLSAHQHFRRDAKICSHYYNNGPIKLVGCKLLFDILWSV